MPGRTVRLAAEQKMHLLQGDGDAYTRQHRVHDHRRDGQGRPAYLAQAEHDLQQARTDGDRTGDLPAELGDQPGDDDGQAGGGPADLQR